MKRILFLSFLMVAALTIGTVVFSSCSQDEAEDTNQTKVEHLKAKAAEFAKKYDVQMSLNEENIEQIAETLTVEQMEQDFQVFANLKDATPVSLKKAPAKTRGLKIKRTKDTEEEETFDRDKEYTGGASTRQTVMGQNIEASLHCRWYYKQTGSSGVTISGALYEDGVCVGSASAHHKPYFNTSFGHITFSLSGTISITTPKYVMSVGFEANQDKISITK